MPGGKRSDRISARDLEVLEFIARFGVVPRSAVMCWAASGRSVTMARERRLREAGLIRVLRRFGSQGPFAYCTAAGLRASGRGELRPARPSPLAFGHDAVVAELAAVLERRGERLLSEREMLAGERADGRRIYSAALRGGRFHRADLLRLDRDGGPGEAIEVELTTKGSRRLDDLLRSWRRAVIERRLCRVTYRCARKTRPHLERAVERTQTAKAVRVEDL